MSVQPQQLRDELKALRRQQLIWCKSIELIQTAESRAWFEMGRDSLDRGVKMIEQAIERMER